MTTIISKKKNRISRRGFTLVELVVVLAMMAILLSVTTVGVLGWIDWATFRSEETAAQDIFYAAQNQLTELDASNSLNTRVMNKLTASEATETAFQTKYLLAKGTTSDSYNKYLKDMKKSDGSSYVWGDMWVDGNLGSESRSIIRLTSKSGDYTRYLNNRGSVGVGTQLLFDLLAPYLADKSVLDGSIALEFSPEAAQVFAVCYSDKAESFTYDKDSDGNPVPAGSLNILNRTLQDREDVLLGYYGVDTLNAKIRGRSNVPAEYKLEIENGNLLSLIVSKNDASVANLGSDDVMTFTIKGSDSCYGEYNKLMTFGIKAGEFSNINVTAAGENPVFVEAKLYDGVYNLKDENNADYNADGVTKKFRIPVWYDSTALEYHIILDAADIQAQSLTYANMYGLIDYDTDTKKEAAVADAQSTFANTYSFYRFGFKDVDYIRAEMVLTRKNQAGSSVSKSIRRKSLPIHDYEEEGDGERTTFASAPSSSEVDSETYSSAEGSYDYGIKTARHLYNVRFETDYKVDGDDDKVFKLQSDIDWSEFVNKANDASETNFCLNSFTSGEKRTDENLNPVIAGVDFDGIVTANIDYSDEGTSAYPFPGFRCLSVGDTFTQEKAFGEDGYFTIEGLNISLIGNVIYGVYGQETATECYNSTTKEYDFKAILGKVDPNKAESSILDNTGFNKARAGLLPLGLFAENLGEISNIVLDRHQVIGLQPIGSNIVYTNMVGGFAGNNIGTIENLTLLDTKYNSNGKVDTYYGGGKTKVNGRTDVGGIIGRESFVVKQDDYHYNETTKKSDKDIVISGMKNYANVSGLENVGGIVGRAYVHYFGDDNTAFDLMSIIEKGDGTNIPTKEVGGKTVVDEQKLRVYPYYNDGYYITDNAVSMTGVEVSRARSIVIENCSNRGRISGDEDLYNKAYTMDGVGPVNRHCSFIGGIAGITQDGFPYADRDLYVMFGKTKNYMIDLYKAAGFFDGSFDYLMEVKNCDSFMLYKKDEIKGINSNNQEIGLIKDICSLSSNSKNKNYVTKNKDNFVGGLIGYSRFTHIEGCNKNKNDLETTGYLASEDSSVIPLVSGSRYVGGITGCSDVCYYSKADGEKYAATNYNLVIGDSYVGGVSGCIGIGDYKQHFFSFRSPATNNAGQPSQMATKDHNDVITGQYLLNNGIALGIKNNWALVNIDDQGQYKLDYNGSTEYNNDCNGPGCVGGVAGASRATVSECDNIQSVGTKKYMLSLIGFSADQIANFDKLTAAEIQEVASQSNFGGNAVGGIIGKVFMYGMVNRKTLDGEKADSELNAIVFGQDLVGGALGNITSVNDYVGCYNFYPVGKASGDTVGANQSKLGNMVVIGRDAVGGIAGYAPSQLNADYYKSNPDANLITNKSITNPYSVYGRIGTGGVCGLMNNDLDKAVNFKVEMPQNSSEKVSVNGIAYTGGVAGICEGRINNKKSPQAKGVISGVEVNGTYFTGGFLGAEVAYNKNMTLECIVNKNVTFKDVTVNSELFAGGLVGLYSAHSSSILLNSKATDAYFIIKSNNNRANEDPQGYLYKLAINNLFDEDGNVISGKNAYNNLINPDNSGESAEKYGFTNVYASSTTEPISFLNGSTIYSSNITVNSGLYSGGLFGYSPDGLNVCVSDFSNAGAISATKTTKATDYNVTVAESADTTVAYSYLGGIIGRVPKGMTLKNCYNTGKLSSAATYLGGLTEVNAGIVMGNDKSTPVISSTDYSYSTGGIGAFVGVNGTNDTDGVNTGVIKYCSNTGELSCANVGGIAAAIGGPSSITNCFNHGDIFTTGRAGGIVCSVMNGVTLGEGQSIDIRSNVNTGLITYKTAVPDSDQRAGIIYDAQGKASVTVCRNYGTGLTNGITGTDALSLKYNFDATNATTHIGSAVSASSKLANFYIDRNTEGLTPGYFTASSYYAYNITSTHPEWNNWGNPAGNNWEPIGSVEPYSTKINIDNLFNTTTDTVTEFDVHPSNVDEDKDKLLTFEVEAVIPDGSTDDLYEDINNFSITWTDVLNLNNYYKYYDDRASLSQDMNDFMLGSATDTRTYKEVAEDEYQNNTSAAGLGFTVNPGTNYFTADDDNNNKLYDFTWWGDKYTKSVYGYMIYEDPEYLANASSWSTTEKINRFTYLLYSLLPGNGSGAYNNNTIYKYEMDSNNYPRVNAEYDSTTEQTYLALAANELKNGSYGSTYLGANQFTLNNNTYSADKYLARYSNIYDDYSASNYNVAYFPTCPNSVGGNKANYDFFSKYIFSTYCYMIYERTAEYEAKSQEEKYQFFIELLYSNIMKYGYYTYLQNNGQNGMTVTYRMIITDNAGKTYHTDGITTDRIRQNDVTDTFEFKNDRLYVNNHAINGNNITVDNGFDGTKVANIKVIVCDNSYGMVAVKSFGWAPVGSASAGSSGNSALFASATKLGDVVNVIKNNGLAEDNFYSEKMSGSDKYQLMLHGYGTGIDNITVDPYTNSYWNDTVTYKTQSTNTVRYKMFGEVDNHYVDFIRSNFDNTVD